MRCRSSVFGSMVAVVFQNVFYLEMHQNNILKKKSILTSAHQNDLKILKNLI